MTRLSLFTDPSRRAVLLLVIAQALSVTTNTIIITTTALTGHMLASDKSLATVPLSLQFITTMLTALPASFLMRRYGRQTGFMIGAMLGLVGGLLGAYAVYERDFVLLCISGGLQGMFQAFALQYRFAAAEVAGPAFRARAVSLVIGGGIVAAIFGPELAIWAKSWFDPVVFAGNYMALAILCGVSVVVLVFVREPRSERVDAPVVASLKTGRPLSVIVRQPVFIVAVLGGMIGYGVMSLVMTATPLAMLACDFNFDETAFVIQWHALAMFAPSLFTGRLIDKFGEVRVMATGAVLYIICVGVNLSGITIFQFWTALVLLGLGWNFLFVGGTTLLTRVHNPEEKAKVQGLNDFLVFGVVSVSSLSAGAIQHALGWDTVNLVVLPLVGIVLAALAWMHWFGPRPAEAGAAS
ncbi:MAG: MFS transporter [Pseudomonadota bacterium]